MKACVLTGSVSRYAGGLYYSVRLLTQILNRYGVLCQAHAFEDECTDSDISSWAPLEVVTYARKGFDFFPISLSLLKTICYSRPDIIHCHGIWQFLSIVDLLLQYKFSTPYLISPHGMLDSWATRHSAWKKKIAGLIFENRHLKNAACIHALCESEAKSIRAYGLDNPIAVIPNGVVLPELDCLKLNVEHSAEKRKLLFLGRIHPKKGLKDLIDAWSLVQKTWGAEWELIIAGWDDGGYLEDLKHQALDLGLWFGGCSSGPLDSLGDDQAGVNHYGPSIDDPSAQPLQRSIFFVGPKFGDEKDALFRSVDAFILPSFSEGLPMAVLEAWSYGLPVLMTPQCNLPIGFLANAAVCIQPEVASIAQGLMDFFALQKNEQRTIGQRGRKLVADQFTWERVAQEMLCVYRWLGGSCGPPACVRFD